MTMSNQALLKLTVNNHPGVLSHICGLFARRAYNLEGVMVRPVINCTQNTSRMWLLVNEDERLPQVIKQTEKLVDVISVEQHEVKDSVFMQTEDYFV